MPGLHGVIPPTAPLERTPRGYAEWLFWESDVFRDLAGIGPGTRTLADIDALLRPLVGLPVPAKAERAPTPKHEKEVT